MEVRREGEGGGRGGRGEAQEPIINFKWNPIKSEI